MLDFEINADLYDDLQDILNEEFIEEVNWAFVIEFEHTKKEK